MIGVALLVSLVLLFFACRAIRSGGAIATSASPWLVALPLFVGGLALQIWATGAMTGSFLFLSCVSMIGMLAAFSPAKVK
ncbi:hypothetical protein K0504_06130 [Neiella marina]|uniref:Uncharacterized protein n=1 Tax=Neiella holothuriorum TaxID=2870530 RepID=A0ABS7EEE9_9GAMM|nr:hypothetical protein [Neiella holothuriorum]MBW8190610.1 hypothetical protein [Neiella holothuriorum]